MTSSTSTPSYSDEIETDWDEVINRFEDMDLNPELVRGIIEYGYPLPATIQQYAIPAILKKRDVLIQMSSGTIQKCTTVITAFQSIDTSNPQCQALILTPTRELAMCTIPCAKHISQHNTVDCYAVIGGTKVRETISDISKGRHLIVGTPGRVLDMVLRGALQTKFIQMVVLEESDEILSRGFQDQIMELFSLLPSNRQVVITSSTISEDVNWLVNQLMQDPVRILLNRDRLALQRVSQYYIDCEKVEWKLDTLLDLIEIAVIVQALVFCNTDRMVKWLGSKLHKAGLHVLTINSNMELAHREVIERKFRAGEGRLLVSTDLPHGRRINTPQIGVVINFDMPLDKLDYVRRIRRTFFRSSVVNFVTKEDQDMIGELEMFYATKIIEAPLNLVDLI